MWFLLEDYRLTVERKMRPSHMESYADGSVKFLVDPPVTDRSKGRDLVLQVRSWVWG
jgi:hypothetical protein